MNLAAPPPPSETSNSKALILSALVHLLLLGALFFGVQWKSQAPSSVAVEVWRAAPPPPMVRAEPVPQVKPEPKPEPKPVPKVEPAPRPDIAIKEKKEEPKKPEPKKEEPKKPEAKKPEPKKEEPKRVEPDFKNELANEQKQLDKQKAVEEARTQAQAEADRVARLKADQASTARARGLADYAAKLRNKIRNNIVLPPNIQGNPEAVFIVTQLPDGTVMPSVKIQKSSGNPQLDAAIERAILKSSPLPKPDQPELFQRVLELKYRPLDE